MGDWTDDAWDRDFYRAQQQGNPPWKDGQGPFLLLAPARKFGGSRRYVSARLIPDGDCGLDATYIHLRVKADRDAAHWEIDAQGYRKFEHNRPAAELQGAVKAARNACPVLSGQLELTERTSGRKLKIDIDRLAIIAATYHGAGGQETSLLTLSASSLSLGGDLRLAGRVEIRESPDQIVRLVGQALGLATHPAPTSALDRHIAARKALQKVWNTPQA